MLPTHVHVGNTRKALEDDRPGYHKYDFRIHRVFAFCLLGLSGLLKLSLPYSVLSP